MPMDEIEIYDQRPMARESANFSGKYSRDIIHSIASEAIRQGINPHTALAISLQENNLGRNRGVGWGAWATPKDFFSSQRNRDLHTAAAEEKRPIDATVGKLLKDRVADYNAQLDEIGEEGGYGTRSWKEAEQARKNAWADRERVDYAVERMPANNAFNAAHFVSTLKGKLDYGRQIHGDSAPEAKLIQAYQGYGKLKSPTTGQMLDAGEILPYGRRILALRQHAIANNPEINRIILGIRGKGMAR